MDSVENKCRGAALALFFLSYGIASQLAAKQVNPDQLDKVNKALQFVDPYLLNKPLQFVDPSSLQYGKASVAELRSFEEELKEDLRNSPTVDGDSDYNYNHKASVQLVLALVEIALGESRKGLNRFATVSKSYGDEKCRNPENGEGTVGGPCRAFVLKYESTVDLPKSIPEASLAHRVKLVQELAKTYGAESWGHYEGSGNIADDSIRCLWKVLNKNCASPRVWIDLTKETLGFLMSKSSNAKAWNLLGVALYSKREYQFAEEVFEAAWNLHGDSIYDTGEGEYDTEWFMPGLLALGGIEAMEKEHPKIKQNLKIIGLRKNAEKKMRAKKGSVATYMHSWPFLLQNYGSTIESPDAIPYGYPLHCYKSDKH